VIEPYGSQIAFKADNGEYLTRANNTLRAPSSSPDAAFVNSLKTSPLLTSASLWMPVNCGNGKYAFMADNGKLLGRCSNCIINGAYSDYALPYETAITSPSAQWTVTYLNSSLIPSSRLNSFMMPLTSITVTPLPVSPSLLSPSPLPPVTTTTFIPSIGNNKPSYPGVGYGYGYGYGYGKDYGNGYGNNGYDNSNNGYGNNGYGYGDVQQPASPPAGFPSGSITLLSDTLKLLTKSSAYNQANYSDTVDV
jgi:hypothetical protein